MAKTDRTFYSKNFFLHGEVRKTEVIDDTWTGKDGKTHAGCHIAVNVLDDDADSVLVLADKDMSNQEKYKRGVLGTFQLRIDIHPTVGAGNADCKILVVGFTPDNENEK